MNNLFDNFKLCFVAAHCDDNWVEVVTPIVDDNGDNIIVYLKQCGNKVVMSEDGETLSDLDSAGKLPDKNNLVELKKAICYVLRNTIAELDSDTYKVLRAEVPANDRTESDVLRFASVINQVRAVIEAYDWLFSL